MLSYILPPIIIIISLSILIMFLFRKSQKVTMQELLVAESEIQPKKRMSIVMSALGQFGLKVLERLTQRSKLLSLKFHNTSNDWFHSIHERRQQGQKDERLNQHRRDEDKIENEKIISEQVPVVHIQEEKPIRPLIREAVTHPRTEVKEKNQLEELLIKRIAINPRDVDAYERLGDYYLESGSYPDAQECFKQVLTLNPTHYKAKIRMRRIEKLMD